MKQYRNKKKYITCYYDIVFYCDVLYSQSPNRFIADNGKMGIKCVWNSVTMLTSFLLVVQKKHFKLKFKQNSNINL